MNGRKLNNKLLKYDYKITKNMKEAIKFNKNIHKLSQNEKDIYYELEKYINKDKSLDILIGSYLSGNNNKKLSNRINKILYDKYKNNLLYKQSTAVERSFYNFIVNLLFTYLHLFIPIAPLECFLVRTPSYVDRDAGRSPRRYDDPVNGGKPGR